MSQQSWDEVKRKLDEEIDAFAKADVAIRVDAVPKSATSDAVVPCTPAVVADQPLHQPATPSVMTQSSLQGGLLARLKQQAAEKLADGERSASALAERSRLINDVLHNTYGYLRDLCEQLNVISPAWPNSFQVSESLAFSDLRWSQGRTDYRKQAGPTEDRPLERVSLRFRLSTGTELVIERENPQMDKLRKQLIDANIEFHLDEYRNAKGYAERGRFTIQPALSAGLLFVGDFNTGDIRLKVLNLPRLGSAEYLIPTTKLTMETLEEIALLVVGESSKFFKHFERLS